MADIQHEKSQPKGKRWGRIGILSILAVLIIFHRPILLATFHWLAVRSTAKQNLHLDFRVGGDVFTGLTIRDLHIVPTGPAAIESAHADYVRAEYDLFSLLRGRSDFLRSIEMRNARIVIDPGKVRVKAEPRPHEAVKLPAVFPESAGLQNVTIIVRNPAHDFIAEDASIDLRHRGSGELRIGLLQLPTGEAWSHVTGSTSYSDRNLILRDVRLNDHTRFALLNIDASRLNQHTMNLHAEAILDDAPLKLDASLTEQTRSLFVQSHVAGHGLAFASLKKLGILSTVPIAGEMTDLAFDFNGLLSSPRTWTMAAAMQLASFEVSGATFDRARLQVSASDGTATFQPVELVREGSTVQLRGSAQLPDRADELGRSPAHLEITGHDLDLARFTASALTPLSGRVQVDGVADVRDQRLHATLRVSGSELAGADASAQKIDLNLALKKKLAVPDNAPWYEGLTGSGSINAVDLRQGDYGADRFSAQIEQTGADVRLKNINLQRGKNQLTGAGSIHLLASAPDLLQQTAELEATISAPEVADFWISDSLDRVSGRFYGAATLRWDGKLANGSFNGYGEDLRIRNLSVGDVSVAGAIWRSKLFLNDLTAKLNARDFVAAQGTFDTLGNRNFAGSVAIDIADVSTLKPLLAATGQKRDLGGSFVMNWQGRGSMANLAENGSLNLDWSRGRLGDLKAVQARVNATYSPAGLNVPTFFLGSNKMDFQASVTAKGETLEISQIQIDQGQAKYASGYISVPFVWRNVGTIGRVIPSDGKVVVSVQSENLDLKKLGDDLGLPPTVSGFLNVRLQADGTLADLRAHLDLDGRDLRNPQLTTLDPATLRLSADAGQNRVNLTGELKQAKIQPVEISATLPFDAGNALRGKSPDENTPLQARLRLPRSSVNFLRQFLPAVEQLDGDLAVDVAIGGTIAQPVFSGSGDITINAARFTDATLPTLRGFQSRLIFRENTLTLDKFRGDLAGGPFTLGGRVVFTKLTEPNIDLDLRAESILIARNDSLTVRADAGLKATGPLASATVKGNVALTNSHFLKDIDLIPIGLPGRPAPPPVVEDRPDYSIREPPMRDWKFDVAIKTKDPFSIRGNLANGGAIADLHLGGTGLHPELKGTVKMQNVEATLPFSRLEVTNGFLYFDPSDSFNPKIDLQGTSVIRDYTVRVFVYGSSLAPQAVFTSEPPLPQEEIISLLATGTTRQELTGNNSVLAGRAAMLVVQQLYRKLFKKGQPTESNSVFDRLQLDVGGVDPRTGHQQATARFKVNENWVLVGDIGVGGEFRGLVKYLIRFH